MNLRFHAHRVIAAFIALLPLWLQPYVCVLLTGHVRHVKSDETRVWFLACELCPHQSAGVVKTAPAYQRTQEGDARRHALRQAAAAARRLPEPAPLDWFEAEHFQGDHARAV